MAIDPITGLDDGQDFQTQLAQSIAQARGAGIPIASAMPGSTPGSFAIPGGSPIDQAGVQRALGQARGVPPMLAAPGPQAPQGVPGLQGLSIFPPQPARREVERSTTTRSRREMGKEEKAAVGQLGQAFDDQISAQRGVDDVAAQKANMEAYNADQTAMHMAARAAKREELMVQGERQLKDAMTLQKAEYDKYRKMEMRDYFAGGEGTMRGVVAALAVAAGELGRMRPGNGGQNLGIELVEREIQKDFVQQRQAIDKQRDVLLQAGENVELVQRFQTHAMNMLSLKEAAAYDSVMARNTANLRALGVPEAEAQADTSNALLRQKKAEAIQNVFEGTRTAIQSTIEKQLVENQGLGGAGAVSPGLAYHMGRDAKKEAKDAQEDKNERTLYNKAGQPIAELPSGTPRQETQKLRESITHYENIQDLAKKLRDSYQTDEREMPGGEVAKQREQWATDLKYEYNQFAAKQGAFSKPDQELIEKAVGSGGGLYVRSPVPTFDALINTMNRRMSTTLGTRGVKSDQVMPKLMGGQTQGAERRQGNDGKWYRKGPQGWEPE
jgi:hypothetical protein